MKPLAAALLAALGATLPVLAQTGGEAAGVPAIEAAPQESATQFVVVMVEGRAVSVGFREGEDGASAFLSGPIFEALKDRVRVDGTRLIVQRYQDGAELSLDMTDGKVRANGVVLGALPRWTPRDTADLWLDINALAVLSGTVPVRDEDTGRWTFDLDDRLRPKFDLDLFVEGRRILTDPAVEPRTIGPVLLVPLEPVVEALGSRVERGPEPGAVSVVRSQDGARITLNLATGLVTVNGAPRGVSPNMTYADADTLLMPFTAVETLTGTNIALPVGSARIEVSLDDRLADSAAPGELVSAEADRTPFTPERLEFALADRGTNTAEFHSRWRGFNTRLRYESIGSLQSPAELAPSFLSLEIRSQSGWTGTAGDYNMGYRETQGVGVTRLRGLSWRDQRDNGDILAIAVGTPMTGASALESGAARPEFSGFAAGVRRMSANGRKEVALAIVGGAQGRADQAVASWQRSFDFGTKDHGLTSAFAAVDAGFFGGDSSGFDLRARADARYELSAQSGVQASLAYDGARFSGLGSDGRGYEGAFNDAVSSRTVASVSVDWRAVEDWGVMRAPVTGVRTSWSQQGRDSAVSVSAVASTRLGENGPEIAVEMSTAQSEAGGRSTTTQGFGARLIQRFDWGQVTASYAFTTSDGKTDQKAVANLTLQPLSRVFDNGARVSVAPAATALWTPRTSFLRVGATASLDSGLAFGERFNLRAQISALQALNAEQARTDLVASVTAGYRLTDRIALQAAYFDDLRGNSDFTIGLRGAVQFAAPRKHVLPQEGRGVLKGQVFYDRNRDGVRQEDEPGLAGVRVSVLGTRLALGADGEGYYTIQNMKAGLYNVAVDRRTLPLGFLVPERARARATVGEGRLTALDIPVIASGQIRGAVFLDANGNGQTDPGERRFEGAFVTLTPLDAEGAPVETRAAAFGQYGFENLAPGRYRLRARIGRDGVVERQVELSETELFLNIPLGLGVKADEPPGLLEDGQSLLAAAP